MMDNISVEENFSIEFEGPAFEQHKIYASALAQSLLALDGLARRSAQEAYGKNAEIEINVKGGFRAGSFIIEMMIQHEKSFTGTSSAVTIIGGVFHLGKWAFGKEIKEVEKFDNGKACVKNIIGDTYILNQCVINVYKCARTLDQLSRVTQTLDSDGANSIKFNSDKVNEVITKHERLYFRQGDGLVLTDNETESILEIVGPKLNGAPEEWTFSEGEGGVEFIADVADEEFLNNVKDRKIKMENGVSIRAVVRTVQRKKIRIRTTRKIIEVKEIFYAER